MKVTIRSWRNIHESKTNEYDLSAQEPKGHTPLVFNHREMQ